MRATIGVNGDNAGDSSVHCPRSGPVPVQANFGRPGPGPKVRSSICLDLDPQGPDRVQRQKKVFFFQEKKSTIPSDCNSSLPSAYAPRSLGTRNFIRTHLFASEWCVLLTIECILIYRQESCVISTAEMPLTQELHVIRAHHLHYLSLLKHYTC